MHYDKKIAVALGVLLVGVVAAFFFRLPDPRIQAPQLVDAKSLDERIADKPIRPYESPAIVGTQRKANPSKVRAASARKKPKFDYNDGFSDPPGVTNVDPPPGNKVVNNNGRGGSNGPATTLGPPEPIKTKNSEDDDRPFAQIPVPDPNSGWEPSPAKKSSPIAPPPKRNANSNRPKDNQPIVKKPSAPSTREYRVQPGDTLSGIAHQLLGRASRYHEIYELNRNTMRSANDLRPGMVLRIPGKSATAARNSKDNDRPFPRRKGYTPPVEFTPPPNTSGRNDKPFPRTSSRTNSKHPLAGDRRFHGVRHSPFIRKQNRPSVTDWKDKPNPRTGNVQTIGGPKQRVYVVKSGDSLEAIAVKFYGTRNAVRRIVDANKGRIDRLDRLYPGTPLVMP